jgi:tRNA U34 5-methylaminomethyl-2-thiouridine-forming methyltransferase MnmC
VHEADFPSLLKSSEAETWPKPHAIMFDAFSPARNPAMWALPVFQRLYELLDPNRPCALPTYSRSTLLRVTLLLSGYYVGVGHPTGEKEETTIAANSMSLLREPLDKSWLQRVKRSNSAEPLWEPQYRQAPLRPETWERLVRHPQFQD